MDDDGEMDIEKDIVEDETTLQMALDQPINSDQSNNSSSMALDQPINSSSMALDQPIKPNDPAVQVRLRSNNNLKKHDSVITESPNTVESTIAVNQQHFKNLKKMSKKTKKDARRAHRYETGETR